jgi:hypothetical protein
VGHLWRVRLEMIPDLLFLVYASALGFTVIIGSAIFIDYAIQHQPCGSFQTLAVTWTYSRITGHVLS